MATFSFLELRERLAPWYEDHDLNLVILFGSAASGNIHAESDLDLAVAGKEPLDLVHMTNVVSRLLHTDAIDLVDLRHATPLLMMEVVRGGRLIYERAPGSYLAFYSLAHRRYVDTAKLRVAQREAIQHFLRQRGAA